MRVSMRKKVINRVFLSFLILFSMLTSMSLYASAESVGSSDQDENKIQISTTVPPRVVSGRGGSHEKGGLSSLSFITDDVKKNLVKVLVDGKEIDSKKYIVSGNLLTVTLNANYLNTLASEGHVIEIVTVNGTANANFTITDENQQNPSNYMDDSDNTNSIVNDRTTPVTPADNFDHNADQNNNTNNTDRNDRTTDNPGESEPVIDGSPVQEDNPQDVVSEGLSALDTESATTDDMSGESENLKDKPDEIDVQDKTTDDKDTWSPGVIVALCAMIFAMGLGGVFVIRKKKL